MSRRKTTEEFIDDSIKIHKYKYDYSLVNYINNKIKVDIKCIKHGHIFKQRPNDHLGGQGCPICGGNIKSNTKEFIEKSNKIHKYKYDYSLVKYKTAFTKIDIKCIKHNHIFEQTPHGHLGGQGCPICGGNIKLNTEEFIEKSKKVHGDKYDYRLVNYINNKTKVIIICQKHGEFKQTPNKHLLKRGCPKCNESRGEIQIRNFLISNSILFESQKTFKNCKNKNVLPFDFYLPKYNLCVEYNGIQHYEPVEYWGGEKKLEYRQNNDKIKTQYCKDNNINLIIIRYDEDILKKLPLLFS